ncbi:alpha/beta hydrolase [Marinicella meishanensis]|uniref:alpha/beta hydrolase n=1 Tax=Marinicella meishanensis TaxID=2873263 RepID=UPI001CBBE5FD|nr:alpha/beta hydrolase [Marinicella sp. NBU2979]
MKFFAVMILLWLLCGTAQSNGAGLFVVNSAIKLTHWVDVIKDVAYGEQDWQRLNVYPQASSAPVVLFIHGGGWYKGSKDQYHFVADALVRRGYVVVIPDYIKYPEGRFPTFVQDVAQATAWVKQHIAEHGGNPAQLLLVGHSAGAHTGALLATDASYLAQVGMQPQELLGFVGLAGPYNFTPTYHQFVATFGRENFAVMLANNHVNGDEPPILLLHGMDDKKVSRFNFDTFKNMLTRHQIPLQTALLPEVGHAEMVLKIHPWFADEVDVGARIDAFVKTQLNATQANASQGASNGQ